MDLLIYFSGFESETYLKVLLKQIIKINFKTVSVIKKNILTKKYCHLFSQNKVGKKFR